ncbi:MAG: DUF5680 domain-containing protein [Bacillota bacterium]
MDVDLAELAGFLVMAKRATYASQGDDASVQPLLPGSKQLEYTLDPFAYRDIYFGSAHFAGQEVVYLEGEPVWSMVYSGGVTKTGEALTSEVYTFLRHALRSVTEERPFRGPSTLVQGPYRYSNDICGDIVAFSGREWIERDGDEVYRLYYSGGTPR